MKLTCAFPDGKIFEMTGSEFKLLNEAAGLHMKHPDALISVGGEEMFRGYLYHEPVEPPEPKKRAKRKTALA